MITIDIPSTEKFANDWAQVAIKHLAQSLVKKRVGGSALKSSFKYHLITGPDGPTKIIISYLNVGKFVDMGVGRGQKLGDVRGNKSLYSALGLHGRVAKKWYSKTMTAEARRLSELMAALYGDKFIAVVNDNIAQQINMEI